MLYYLLYIFLSFFVANQIGGTENLSAYECGFEPFEDARNTFDVRFYVIALMFIIFDLEVTFIVPWAVTLTSQSSFGLGNDWFFNRINCRFCLCLKKKVL